MDECRTYFDNTEEWGDYVRLMVELVEALLNQSDNVVNVDSHFAIVLEHLKTDMCQSRSGKALLCDLLINDTYPHVKSKITPTIEKCILTPLEDLAATNTMITKPLTLIQRLVDLKTEDKTLTSGYLKAIKTSFKQDAQCLKLANDNYFLSKVVGFFILDKNDLYSRSTQVWFREKEVALHGPLVQRIRSARP